MNGSYLSVATHNHLFATEHHVSGPLQPGDQHNGVTLNTTELHCRQRSYTAHNRVTLPTTVLHCTQQSYTQHNRVTLPTTAWHCPQRRYTADNIVTLRLTVPYCSTAEGQHNISLYSTALLHTILLQCCSTKQQCYPASHCTVLRYNTPFYYSPAQRKHQCVLLQYCRP